MAKNIRVKPGKPASILGLVVGCIFVGIGLFVAIPTFGAFGILWTLVAVAITAINGINAFSEKGIVSSTIVVEEDDAPRPSSPEERLRRLEELYEKRLISREEYEESRKRILSEL